MKVIVAGSRSFNDYRLMKQKLDAILRQVKEPIEIVSGTADGADKLGERYARERGHQVKQFPADWDKWGKKAGFIRNAEMAQYATHCVVFWDGESKGTESMMALARLKQIPLRVINFKK